MGVPAALEKLIAPEYADSAVKKEDPPRKRQRPLSAPCFDITTRPKPQLRLGTGGVRPGGLRPSVRPSGKPRQQVALTRRPASAGPCVNLNCVAAACGPASAGEAPKWTLKGRRRDAVVRPGPGPASYDPELGDHIARRSIPSFSFRRQDHEKYDELNTYTNDVGPGEYDNAWNPAGVPAQRGPRWDFGMKHRFRKPLKDHQQWPGPADYDPGEVLRTKEHRLQRVSSAPPFGRRDTNRGPEISKQSPGPLTYHPQVPRRGRFAPTLTGRESTFKLATYALPGPGQYDPNHIPALQKSGPKIAGLHPETARQDASELGLYATQFA